MYFWHEVCLLNQWSVFQRFLSFLRYVYHVCGCVRLWCTSLAALLQISAFRRLFCSSCCDLPGMGDFFIPDPLLRQKTTSRQSRSIFSTFCAKPLSIVFSNVFRECSSKHSGLEHHDCAKRSALDQNDAWLSKKGFFRASQLGPPTL